VVQYFQDQSYIEEIDRRQGKIRVKYKIVNSKKFLTYSELLKMSIDLDIAEWEMNRTHWAIKNVDLHKELDSIKKEHKVPDVLLSGNHAEIEKWREKMKKKK